MALKQVFHSAAEALTGWRIGQHARGAAKNVPVLKSGLPQLDRATELNGLPAGRLIELISPDTGGGLSVLAKIAAKFQRQQMPVLILDLTGQFEAEHAIRCGLVAPELLCHRPDNVLALINRLESSARQVGLIGINYGFIPTTLGAVPAPSLQALLQRLVRIISHSEAVFLAITNLEDSNPLIHTNYLPPFPLYERADLRLWLQDVGWIKRKGEVVGYRGNITVIKNRLGGSGKGADIRIPFVNPELVALAEALDF